MKIERNGHKRISDQAKKLWLEWAKLYEDGTPVSKIAKMYKHKAGKRKGKTYAARWIYSCFKKLEKLSDEEIKRIKNL